MSLRWNDDVIAMNQFADVLKSGTEAVSAALDTEGEGVPVVVFNPLNIAREDVVEAAVDFPGGIAEGGARGCSGWKLGSGADLRWQGAV